jgi:predicted ATPase
VRSETVWKNGAQLLARPTVEDERDPLLRTQTALEQISENQAFRELADFFKSVAYQHLLPQVVRDPRGFSPLPIQNDPYGRDFLARVWKTAPQTRAARLKKIQQALQGTTPQLAELRVETDETGVPHLIGVYAHWRPRGAQQNESQFSDGTLRLFGLLWAVFEGGGPLLLEEPELSLHPEIVRRLPAILYRIVRARAAPRQIIISTHSSEMLSDPGIAAEEVLLLKPGPTGTQLVAPDEADRRAMRAGLTAADALIPQTAPEKIEQILLELGNDR